MGVGKKGNKWEWGGGGMRKRGVKGIKGSGEGCNVYMELRKDGTPVNPVDYMTKR